MLTEHTLQVMGFLNSPLIKTFRKFDSSLFTQRGINGVKGT